MSQRRTPTERREVALLAATLVAGLLTGGCGTPKADDGPDAGSPLVPLSRGDFERELLLTGELEAVHSIAVKAPETSQFQMRIQFMAEEGSTVAEGDSLLDFDNSAFANEVQNLETRILDAETQIVSRESALASALKDLEIEVAEKEYEYERSRIEASVDPDVLSRKEYSERQLTLSTATEQLEETLARIELTSNRGKAEVDVLVIDRDKLKKDLITAKRDLELLSIKAPSRGLVIYEKRNRTTLRFQEGDSCWPGQTVIRLPDLSAMQVVLHVNEVDAPLLEVGMPLGIHLDAFPGRELEAEITQIPSMAVKLHDRSKVAIFRVVVRLSETWVGEMKPGMSVLGRVIVDRRRDVPLVWRAAVVSDHRGYHFVDPTRLDAPEQRIRPLSRNALFYVISDDEYETLRAASPARSSSAPRRAEGGEDA